MLNTLRVKKLNEYATLPTRATDGDAGLDLYASEFDYATTEQVRAVSTGIAVEIPYGYVGLVHPRSGTALRNGLTVVNAPGTIDAGYRGEVKVLLTLIGRMGYESLSISPGDRIAQLVIQKVELPTVEEAEELSDSVRGVAGFGSSGV